MQPCGQLKTFLLPSQGELSQFLINIFLQLQVMTFHGTATPSLFCHDSDHSGIYGPTKSATANTSYIPPWGVGIETKMESKIFKSTYARQKEKWKIKAPEFMDNRW